MKMNICQFPQKMTMKKKENVGILLNDNENINNVNHRRSDENYRNMLS